MSIIRTDLTQSQMKTISNMNTSEAYSPITRIEDADYSNRIRVRLSDSKTGFTYYLYIGKRGKIFETESGEY